MRRVRRRIRKKKKLKRYVRRFIFLGILMLIPIFLISKFYFSQTVASYATNKAKLHMSIIVNDAISKEVVPNIITEDLMLFKTKSNGHVTNVIIDVYQINNVLSKMTADIQKSLNQRIINEELVMPMGIMFNHPLANNVGPDIKINIRMVGNVETDIVTRTKPYGINNSLMEVLIKTKVTFLVILPFQQEEVSIETHTPLVIKMIQGEVPQYYYSSNSGNFAYPPNQSDGGGANNPSPPSPSMDD